MTICKRLLGGAAAALALVAAPVAAQTYPERPITMIVPWSAGGTTDIVARLFAAELGEELGQPVAVTNVVGGGGALGTQQALESTDGYTVIMTTSGNHILTPLANDVDYTPEDFVGLGQLSVRTLVLAVLADKPWQDLADLQEAAAANPGGFTFGAVPNVLPYLTLASWTNAADVELLHVPQQGGAPGVNGVLGGILDMVPESLSSVQQHLQAGTMRGLAVFNAERDPVAPDVPTAAEQGFEVFGNPFTGLAVARGVPEEVITTLREATAKIAQDAAFQERMVTAGDSVSYLDGDAFEAVWARDWAAYMPILQGD